MNKYNQSAISSFLFNHAFKTVLLRTDLRIPALLFLAFIRDLLWILALLRHNMLIYFVLKNVNQHFLAASL